MSWYSNLFNQYSESLGNISHTHTICNAYLYIACDQNKVSLFLRMNTFCANFQVRSLKYHREKHFGQLYCIAHTSSVERFSENFDQKVVTYLIFFVGTHWFQKCNLKKNSLSPFWGLRGRWGQTTSKLEITKILNENPLKVDEIQNDENSIMKSDKN